MREYIGDLGHFSVILFFVLSVLSCLSYFIYTLRKEEVWLKLARIAYIIHAVSILSIVVSLFIIIQNHYYEYHYAWSHSSNFLPKEYMISCFWEGQEGSFLLWAFWHAVLGFFLWFRSKSWEPYVMYVFMAVQAFLASMILGVVLPIYETKLGSSPFILMKEALGHLPVFADNPNFIPEDGTGLNPLLQNYWMVIHPPTLFLGFAMTTIPFTYVIAGLWQNKLTEWMKPSLSWLLMAGGILGLGIMMGAYWAYETLNFGGYWNWDPVENAVYVPWLIIVASIHGITIYRRNQKAKKTTTILTIASFLLILYSTFLTRSGILGESSVHSFTDLGLSGQLLVYLVFFILLSIVFMAIRWKDFGESSELKAKALSFWVLVGIILLCIASFHVILATSFPVINALFGTKLATPTNQVTFYSNFQLWPAMFITILSGVVQYLWWSKQDVQKQRELAKWGIILLSFSLFAGLAIVLFYQDKSSQMQQVLSLKGQDSKLSLVVEIFSHTLLFALSFFSCIANALVLWKLASKNWKLTGGALAHLGLAMMLIGILLSGGYSRVISLNQSGKLYSRDLPDEINTENVLLWRGKPAKMKEYQLTYVGPRVEVEGFPAYAKISDISLTEEPHYAVVANDLVHDRQTYFKTGDTVRIYPENTYYEIEYEKEGKKLFSLFPRAQVNPTMGLLASPDIKHGFTRDLYTHISTIPDPEEEVHWRDTVKVSVRVKERFYVNDYVTTLDSVKTVREIAGQKIKEGAIGIAAFLTHSLANEKSVTRTEMLIQDDQAYTPTAYNDDLGMRMNFLGIDPRTGIFEFQYSTKQLDYIILKAQEKPWINILWAGTVLMVLGFILAFAHRLKAKTI